MGIKMALSVFRLRVAGERHQVALEIASERFECAESTVGEAFQKYRNEARSILVTERELAGPRDQFGNLFTSEESRAIWLIMEKGER
jgi:hypothetical protein